MPDPNLPSLLTPAEASQGRSIGLGESILLPAIISREGDRASRRFVEFFTAEIRNSNTRRAYARAVTSFLDWCEARGLSLNHLNPVIVATWVESRQREAAPPSVKQELAAVRMFFDYLVLGQVVPASPAASVRGPRYVVKKGKTPVLEPADARAMLDAIDCLTVVGLRDRALIAVMVYSFARVGAVVKMRVEDYFPVGKRWWLRLHEKGGKLHEVPAHHKAEEYMDAYLQATGIAGSDRKGWLFRSVEKRNGPMTSRALATTDVLRMVKRRARAAGLAGAADVCCHTFRATGITSYMENGGTLEIAQAISSVNRRGRPSCTIARAIR